MSSTISTWHCLRRIVLPSVIVAIGSAGFPVAGLGEPVTTIRNNGNPANRVDFVILGDGYRSTQLAKYQSDAEMAVQGFFAQQPYQEYQRYFNVHRVDVKSAQSGADHPERIPPVIKSTFFDATYNCSGIQRLVCVDGSKVDTVLGRSVGVDQRDMVLVLVNDTEYGGSGGAISVASLNPAVTELVLHETGHSFGLLADEYDFGPPPPCHNALEPPEVNVTREIVRARIKWNNGGGPPKGWIDPATPIPTMATDPGVPGLYEGGKYCAAGLFRPTYDSKMRNLGRPFEQINEEQLIRRIYNFVSPLDSSRPIASTLVLQQGTNQLFRVSVPTPQTHSLKVRWSVDRVVRGTRLRFNLDSSGLTLGRHTIKVTVRDLTGKVRSDPSSVLREQRTWNVWVRS